MIDLPVAARATRCAVAISCLLAAGCAGFKHAPPQETVPAVPPAVPTAVVEELPAPVAPAAGSMPADVEASRSLETVPVKPSPIEPLRPAEPPAVPRPAVSRAPAAAAPATRTAAPEVPAAVPTAPAPAPAPQVVPRTSPAPVAARPPAVPLDLKALESRLRQTKAIGVMTKLSLKNQVDDLIEKFRAYHKRQGKATLTELRRNYDMLLLKVLSLLQDSDPPLARDIVRSRAAIWGILEDPRKFTESNLMAGATP